MKTNQATVEDLKDIVAKTVARYSRLTADKKEDLSQEVYLHLLERLSSDKPASIGQLQGLARRKAYDYVNFQDKLIPLPASQTTVEAKQALAWGDVPELGEEAAKRAYMALSAYDQVQEDTLDVDGYDKLYEEEQFRAWLIAVMMTTDLTPSESYALKRRIFFEDTFAEIGEVCGYGWTWAIKQYNKAIQKVRDEVKKYYY